MPGVIERVVENWLTSSNERSYQIAFCQLLVAEGETVVYISPHGPFEQGKDVVTLDKKGNVRGYQLKCGDFGLAEWREHKGEINDLVELPIQHPAVQGARHHTSFLVTNGNIKDPALKAINSANEAWRKRRYPALRTISGSELLKRFLAVNGTYLPQELSDLTVFLELVLRNGREPADKAKLSKLLESILPLATTAKVTKTGMTRSISSAVLVTGYTLEHAYRSENHWAIFETWILAASYVLAVATKAQLSEKEWVTSFDLCELGALNALSNLCSDCETREHLVEGDPWTDGHVYHARVTLLVGLLCAWSLHHCTKGTKCARGEFIGRFLHKNLSGIKMWGESAIPYFVMTALEMESRGEQIAAESLLVSAATTVLDVNGRREGRPGLPSPYYSPEEALRFVYGLDQFPLREDFVGATYTTYPLIDFLVRRWRRQALRSLWYVITGNTLNAFYPLEKWEWFRWRAETGTLASRFLGSPQSWAELLQEVEGIDASVLPETLRERPGFAILFTLVYPHRFTRELLKLIESALTPGT
jgi:hypothetical protein